ncbi:MAG TPA: BtpA/SgcQ family protein [Clostridia bacterium]|nr:BtpA/SgcQ family protein [Clostridia bacterium]
MEENRFRKAFGWKKPIFGMLHLQGEDEREMLETALEEVRVMAAHGVDAVVIENYFGHPEYVETALDYFSRHDQGVVYGVNLLDDDAGNFRLACKYNAAFLQLDSVAGHLAPCDDIAFGEFIADNRGLFNGIVLGGVRFKYQPYKSGRSLEEDLAIGMARCDAVTITGDATGQETPLEKVRLFRRIVGGFPLVIGAGLTPENCAQQLADTDGAIVGSYFKDTYQARGKVCAEHVGRLMEEVRRCREGGAARQG